MTRNYGKKPPRKNLARGGFVDYFGDPVEAHINAAGGITEGEDPRTRPLVVPGRVSKIQCWSEHSTFNRPGTGRVQGVKDAYDIENDAKRARDVNREPGTYAHGGLVKKGKK